MMQWLGLILMVLGATFMAIAALGIIRLQDLFTRMQAATKSGVAGAGLILIGTALFLGQAEVTAKCLVVLAFLFLTQPVAAHLLSRAAYRGGVPLHPATSPDEFREDLQKAEASEKERGPELE